MRISVDTGRGTGADDGSRAVVDALLTAADLHGPAGLVARIAAELAR